jgi:hypothetical protein
VLAPDPLEHPRAEVLLAHQRDAFGDARRRRQVHRVLDRDQHHQRVRVRRPQPLRHLDSVHARHAHVEQHQLRLQLGDRRERLLTARRLPDRREPRGGLDHLARDPAEHRLVIDREDPDVHLGPRRAIVSAGGGGAADERPGEPR